MGAWSYGSYKFGMNGTADPRLAAAIHAIKQELIYNGFAQGIVLDLPVYGDSVRNRVKDFQASKGLTVDGQVGSKTSLELFRKRVVAEEQNYNLPSGTIGKKLKLESLYDPVAVGSVDPDDTGIAQINVRIHDSVSIDEAFDPAFAIDWAAKYVSSQRRDIGERANIIKAARAAYNIGQVYATAWMLSGFATSGGPDIGGVDSFERATQYIALIDAQTW